MRITLAAIALIAAGAALAQDRARTGTVTNPPPISGSVIDPGGAVASPDSPPARSAEPDVHHTDSAVKQQADAKRRETLEHCQTLTGASRGDCVKRADEEFRRATGDDTLSDRGPDPFYG